MDTQEHIDTITAAQELIAEALTMLQDVARSTRNGWAENYIIAPLSILINGEHGYISRDANLDDWIKSLLGDEDEEAGDACPFCDGPVEPDPTRPGVAICQHCAEPVSFTPVA